MNKDTFVLEPEEERLLGEIEGGLWKDDPLTESEKKAYQASAAYTRSLQEKKRASIQFPLGDLVKLRAKSKEAGIGYEQIVQSLVHNYVNGKIHLEI